MLGVLVQDQSTSLVKRDPGGSQLLAAPVRLKLRLLKKCKGKPGDGLYENPDALGVKFCDSSFAAHNGCGCVIAAELSVFTSV